MGGGGSVGKNVRMPWQVVAGVIFEIPYPVNAAALSVSIAFSVYLMAALILVVEGKVRMSRGRRAAGRSGSAAADGHMFASRAVTNRAGEGFPLTELQSIWKFDSEKSVPRLV
jgi:hypothetical protein